jgi:hypothetical protein
VLTREVQCVCGGGGGEVTHSILTNGVGGSAMTVHTTACHAVHAVAQTTSLCFAVPPHPCWPHLRVTWPCRSRGSSSCLRARSAPRHAAGGQ